MIQLACVRCRIMLKPSKIGVYAEECFGDGRPYKLWAADRYGCPGCGAEILAGFGDRPIAEHYQAEYAATRDRLRPVILDGQPRRCRCGDLLTVFRLFGECARRAEQIGHDSLEIGRP